MNKYFTFAIIGFLILLLFFLEIKKTKEINFINNNVTFYKTTYKDLLKTQYLFDKAILTPSKEKAIVYLQNAEILLEGLKNPLATKARKIIKQEIKKINLQLKNPYIEANFFKTLDKLQKETFSKYKTNIKKLNELKNLLSKNTIFIEILIVILILMIILLHLLYNLYYSLKEEFSLDFLTKAYNRNKFYEISANLPKGKHLLIMADIDHFKSINDTYGHHVGDMILKETVNIIKKNIRKNDYVFRWGGEEFLILLQNTNINDGIKVTEKIRKAINENDFEGIKITSSFGIKEITNKITKEDLIEVDKALYKSKEKRNTITCV